MKTVYYTASSLDGFIVDTADSLDWLISRDIDQDGPFGYDEFIKTIGALVMGSSTYEWIVKDQPNEWAYEQPTWVLTHRPEIVSAEHPVELFSGEVAELHPQLAAAAAGKDVWVVGGGEVAAQFVTAGLIDEMIVSYAPCSLGAGSPVLPVRSEWTLAECARNGDFVCARWVRAAAV
ncbi:dihydrofolate reductase family protein [Mycolicibacterium lutetiense]|uniref:Dihydrofolate reductase n=1 Tax=Mycolicibacterium lutetiense TaxID=1641992 RepID=A0ABS4ZZI2_9MYCO|nr:dihydrofolate reductase family protein [Mycolicibacterium lutetiense]MBP2454905.1 dihydrofolate reductase [Mycolicibacterium lutetiense]